MHTTKTERTHTTKIGHIEDLFVHLERIFSIGGIWPFKQTYIRFTIYISYFILYLIMTYANFCNVFGNLELMVMNLVETIAYTMTFTIIWIVRCSKLLKCLINVVKKDMMERKFEDSEEEKIYYNYNYISKIFTYGSIVGMFITVMLLYFRPLMLFLMNDQVFHICGELSILSYRIKNIKVQSMMVKRFRTFVRMHLKIIWMAKSVDDIFNFILLDELLSNSIVLAISMYYVIMNLAISELATCFTFIFFAAIALVIIYGCCLISDQLTQQCINVLDAYYECDWYEMPLDCKRCLLICMIRGQVMLHLTAGRFYIFSLNSFTNVIKTSLAYLSMLRTVL
ncbi:uncharacterized protein LOC105278594 isoform X2 [Ooceraea biroi]|uniref:uncharacterized protein LOC105278594 isoform X2 n=1 Tax=Ooceraea biroi TaxID=2015173 RepID=UPI00097162FB|nr:uncharacterized protein LOC105278594 isoform X2 [Ooceraea biroi]